MFPFPICNFIVYRHSARVILAGRTRSQLVDERSCFGCRQFLGVDSLRPVIRRLFTMKRFNKPDAANLAITSHLHIGRHWRVVADLAR